MLCSLHSNGDFARENGMTSTRRTEGQNLVVGGCETRRDVTFVVYFQISLSLSFLLHADDDIVLLLSVCLVAATPTPRCICCCYYYYY